VEWIRNLFYMVVAVCFILMAIIKIVQKKYEDATIYSALSMLLMK
jgi:hypothetical protein